MFPAKSAGPLMVAVITLTTCSCSKNDLPETAAPPPQQTPSLLNTIEHDPFNYVYKLDSKPVLLRLYDQQGSNFTQNA